MKPSALRFFVCPRCKGDLSLKSSQEDAGEVLSGKLHCARCGDRFPIARGIPRFVAADQYARSFGRQWNWFREIQLDSRTGMSESAKTLFQTTGWRPQDYRGHAVLDAGVGAGRFAEVASEHATDVVGIDISDAVEAAYANVGRRPNVHIAQADIFCMPFRDETFDLAYSIGVLHHTPDTARAFERVAATVKKGGAFAVYLYAAYGIWYRASDVLRALTTRLPLSLMRALSALAIPLYYVHRLPVIGSITRFLAPISLHPDWRWRWLDTFDWYTPTYQWKLTYPEVMRWYRAGGFLDVEIFDAPISMRGTKTGV
jgi:SAM-dependent methyltransferase